MAFLAGIPDGRGRLATFPPSGWVGGWAVAAKPNCGFCVEDKTASLLTLISTRNRIAPYFGTTIKERYEQVLYVCGLARVKAVVASVCIHPSPSEAPERRTFNTPSVTAQGCGSRNAYSSTATPP
jgi:hypothetical protein